MHLAQVFSTLPENEDGRDGLTARCWLTGVTDLSFVPVLTASVSSESLRFVGYWMNVGVVVSRPFELFL